MRNAAVTTVLAATLAAACTGTHQDLAIRDTYPAADPAGTTSYAGIPDCGAAQTVAAMTYEQIYFEEAARLSRHGADLLYDGKLRDAETSLLLSLVADPYRIDTHAVLAELYAIADRPGCVAILLDRVADLGAYPTRQEDVAMAAEFLRGALGLADHIDHPRVHAAAVRLGERAGVAARSFGAEAPGKMDASWATVQLTLLPALPEV